MKLLLALLLALPASAQISDVRVLATGGKSITTWHGQADLQALQLELGHALSPRTAVALQAGTFNLWQPRSWFGNEFGDGHEPVRAVSAALLIRRAFRTQSRVQWYVEGGTGPMYAQKRVPASTSRFNFNTQIGTGLVLNARGRFPIIAGYRFLHISNGGYAPRNPGLNVSAAILGIQLRSATPRLR
jgi:Lipid A 3-O-deacylase (PagL)